MSDIPQTHQAPLTTGTADGAARERGILLANPRSGAADDDGEEIRAAAADAGLEVVDLVPSLDLRAFIESRIESGTKLFVVAGGDGSIHAAAQGLVNREADLAVVPMGSLNHFARDLGLPLEWREALAVALAGKTRAIDVGRINGRYFLNNVLIGVYARISEYRERYRGSMGKWRAYAKSIRMALRHFHHVSLALEASGRKVRIRTQLFTVSVGMDDLSRLGLLAPRTDLAAGALHVYWLPRLSRGAFALAIARYILGVSETFGDFESIGTDRLSLDFSRPQLRVAVDGELSRLSAPVEIEVIPSGLRVRVP
ncbi:MAG: diacylglycerol kinase family protein [Acidobacteriota bacterium]